MTDISIIILQKNEALHIKRCLEMLAPLEPRQVFVVDCFSTDGSDKTAAEMGATVVQREWPGLYAPQLNWALENLPIESEWVMRLDADEYFLPEAIEELKEKLPTLPADVTGVISKRRHYIFGGWAKRGTYPVKLLRVFRRGKAFCEQRHMDEHMLLREGRAVEFEYDFVDHNLSDFAWWKDKHLGYAKREALDAIEGFPSYAKIGHSDVKINRQLARKRKMKAVYYCLPPYLRAFFYFVFRYFLCLGFLDGKVGFKWHYWQGLWYRLIVDREIRNVKRSKRLPLPEQGVHGNAALAGEKTDIAVIILQKDEALHIKRCLERLAPLQPKQIFVVDCFSTDGSDKTAAEMGATVVYHEWPGLYAKQFNWALDNLPIASKWILRLDADEYITNDTICRLKTELGSEAFVDVSGITLELKRRFMGGEIRYGTNGIRLLRVWRYGRGRLEDRAMDEHAQVEGRIADFNGAFYDDNLNSFEWWQEKHRGYAKREAIDAISLFGDPKRLQNPSVTDRKKIRYYKFPPYFRAVAYFCMRYFFKLGFLDGRAGWRWHFWQGLWYRWIVDREIARCLRGKPG